MIDAPTTKVVDHGSVSSLVSQAVNRAFEEWPKTSTEGMLHLREWKVISDIEERSQDEIAAHMGHVGEVGKRTRFRDERPEGLAGSSPARGTKFNNDWVREKSGEERSSDPVVAFVYDLARDHLPIGTIEKVIQDLCAAPLNYEFTNGWLAKYAKSVSLRLSKIWTQRL